MNKQIKGIVIQMTKPTVKGPIDFVLKVGRANMNFRLQNPKTFEAVALMVSKGSKCCVEVEYSDVMPKDMVAFSVELV